MLSYILLILRIVRARFFSLSSSSSQEALSPSSILVWFDVPAPLPSFSFGEDSQSSVLKVSQDAGAACLPVVADFVLSSKSSWYSSFLLRSILRQEWIEQLGEINLVEEAEGRGKVKEGGSTSATSYDRKPAERRRYEAKK